MSTILSSLLESPMVLYTIALTVAWTLVQIIPKVSHREALIQRIDSGLIIIAFVLYLFLTVLFIRVNVDFFPYLHAIMLAFTLLSILGSSKKNSRLLSMATFAIALMPVVVMVSTKHPFPLGDDCRFLGFAEAIAEDGRWIPFKYAENPYYQFFNIIPFLEYVLASTAGVGFENVAAYYLALKFCLYLTYLTFVYLVVKKLTKDDLSPLVAVLVLSITPPLALTQVVHQAYACVLFLTTAHLLLKRFGGIRHQAIACTVVTYPLMVAGLVAHATYTIMILAFVLPFVLARGRWIQDSGNGMMRSVGLLVMVSFAFWTYTYVLDVIIRPTVNAMARLVDLLTGSAPFIPFQGTAQPWYTPEVSEFFIAWALVPAIVGSYALLSVLRIIRGRDNELIAIMGFIGLGATVTNYVLRTLPTFGGRYFYWLYLLMLPLAATVVRSSCKSFIGLVFSVVLISTASFYGIQDLTLAANTYGDYVAWADRTSWNIGQALIPHLSPRVQVWLDPRIGGPILASSPPLATEILKTQHVLVVIGMDKVGLQAMQKDPRNVNFFAKAFGVKPENLVSNIHNVNVVFSAERYLGIWL